MAFLSVGFAVKPPNNRDPYIHLNIALQMVVSPYFGGTSHASNSQNVSFKEPCFTVGFAVKPPNKRGTNSEKASHNGDPGHSGPLWGTHGKARTECVLSERAFFRCINMKQSTGSEGGVYALCAKSLKLLAGSSHT